jgi:predicted amidohydrolase
MSALILAVAQSIATPGNLAQSIDHHARLAAIAAAQGARLVLFPELSLTGYDRGLTRADAVSTSDPRLRPLRELADASDLRIIVGAPVASTTGLQIGALSFLPGAGVASYTKQHLHAGEEVAFVAGQGGEPLQIDGLVVGHAICADITHPEHARAAAHAGSTVYAAGCFITQEGYAADAALLQGYAQRHQMLVLMANYGAPLGGWSSAGRSAIWSDTGALLACGPSAGEALVLAERSHSTWVGRVVRPAHPG